MSNSDQKGIDKDTILTIQIFKDHLNPRTFKVPEHWFTRAALFAWSLLLITAITSIYAVKEYFSERAARPALINELENEVQQLKIALEKKTEPQSASTNIPGNPNHPDPNATDTQPKPGPGTPLEGRTGAWGGLAEGIVTPPAGTIPTVKLDDPRVEWIGKFANFSAGVSYREAGKGSQQGHIVVLARGPNQIASHPDGVLNVSSGDALFDPSRGEYFSVSRFRPLKTHLGPFDFPSQLSEIQVFIFDLNNKLILLQTFKGGK